MAAPKRVIATTKTGPGDGRPAVLRPAANGNPAPIADARAGIAQRLAAARPGPGRKARVRGDFDLNPHLQPPRVLRPAAVLVPLVDHGDGWSVLLTQRTVHLSAHAGQISFPGGGREPRDADGRATALRETQEELGIAPAAVTVLGRLDTYLTRTGFEIEPVVGVLTPPLAVTPDPFEVADVFEVPLAFVLGERMPATRSRVVAERDHRYYVFPYGERYIWGATAGMLVNLREVLLAQR